MLNPFPCYRAEKPYTRLFVGDCLEVMPYLHDNGERFDLIIADPPYNFGRDYDVWNDKLPMSEYKAFTQDWMHLCARLLSPIGSMWILVPDEIVAWVDTVATNSVCNLTRINWCIWHFRFGQCNNGKFIRSKAHLLYYAKSKERIWHPEKILEPSDRASVYNDPRTQATDTPGLRVPLDVWYGPFLGRVQGNNTERRKQHDNQVPEKLLQRILLACTHQDSRVLDPFSGSGGTSTVARSMGLQSTTIELSQAYAESSWHRITQIGAVRELCCQPSSKTENT